MVWGPDGPKRIDSVKAGDKVYSYDEENGALVIVPVEKVFKNGKMECVHVRSKTGHTSICTPDHLYYTTNSNGIAASDLNTSDILLEINDYPRYDNDVSDSEAIILGYLITDGYYGRDIHFTNTSWKYLLDFQNNAYKYAQKFDWNKSEK